MEELVSGQTVVAVSEEVEDATVLSIAVVEEASVVAFDWEMV